MGWKNKRAHIKRRTEEEEEKRKEREKEEALKQANIEYTKEERKNPHTKDLSSLEDIHSANLLKKKEREIEIEEARKERKKKLHKKEEWKRKFNQRTKKGQIPLDHRINYMFKRIEEISKKE